MKDINTAQGLHDRQLFLRSRPATSAMGLNGRCRMSMDPCPTSYEDMGSVHRLGTYRRDGGGQGDATYTAALGEDPVQAPKCEVRLLGRLVRKANVTYWCANELLTRASFPGHIWESQGTTVRVGVWEVPSILPGSLRD